MDLNQISRIVCFENNQVFFTHRSQVHPFRRNLVQRFSRLLQSILYDLQTAFVSSYPGHYLIDHTTHGESVIPV